MLSELVGIQRRARRGEIAEGGAEAGPNGANEGGAGDAADPSGVGSTARDLVVTNAANEAAVAGYSVRAAVVDLVSLDPNDVRVLGPSGKEVPRWLDPSPPGESGALWFALEADLAAGASATYELALGAGAAAPKSRGTFMVEDEFADGRAGHLFTQLGSPIFASGRMTIAADTQAGIATGASDPLGPHAAVEALVDAGGFDGQDGSGWWVGFQRNGDFEEELPWVLWYGNFFLAGGVQADGECAPICYGQHEPAVAGAHRYRVERGADASVFYVDGRKSAELPSLADDLAVMMRTDNWHGPVVVSWLHGRPLVSPEPTVAVGSEHPSP